MLQNELLGLENLINSLICTARNGAAQSAPPKTCLAELSIERSKICEQWEAAIFSEVPDHSLKRYFSFHLNGIRQLSDTIQNDDCASSEFSGLFQEVLLSLIDFMHGNFNAYFDEQAISPLAYRNRLGPDFSVFKGKITESVVYAPLKETLLGYIEEAYAQKEFAYKTFFYIEALVRELQNLDFKEKINDVNKQLTTLFIRMNFNHLGVFICLQDLIRMDSELLEGQEKMVFLQQWKQLFTFDTLNDFSFDDRWPPLQQMLRDWIGEALSALVKHPVNENNALHNKLSLNLSVAQLACLLRLFFEEQWINQSNLTDIFKFMCRNYTTKRQLVISPASFSKEYYSINQFTAAFVRDMLQKMLLRINRSFFPAMAVISVLICAR